MSPSSVNIRFALPSGIFRSETDYINGGSQSLRRGLAVHLHSRAEALIGDTSRRIIAFPQNVDKL